MENLGALYTRMTYVLLSFACGFKYRAAYKVVSLQSWCSNKKKKNNRYIIGVWDAMAAFADHRTRRHGFDLRLSQSCCVALDKLLRGDLSGLQFPGCKCRVQLHAPMQCCRALSNSAPDPQKLPLPVSPLRHSLLCTSSL